MVWQTSKIGPIEDIKRNVEEVKAHVQKFSKPDLYLAIRALVVTAVLHVGFFAAHPIATKHWALWAILVFHRGVLYDRLFVIFHDCCHGSFFKSSRANLWVGRFLGSLQMTSYSGWHKNHNIDHHMNLAKDDHPMVDQTSMVGWTTKEWESYSLPRKIFLRFARDPIFFFTFVPTFIFMAAGVHNGKLPLIEKVVPSQPPYRIHPMDPIDRILPTLLPALQATTVGIILFHLQHAAHIPNLYFDIPRDEHDRDLAGLMGSTFQYVPEWLKWATNGIEYHHIHHFSTRVPSYRIRACHDSAPPATWRYVKYLNLEMELQSLLLVMWNPDKHRFESFPELNWLLGINDSPSTYLTEQSLPNLSTKEA
ncbi:hypothetical protein COCSUDRAFT_47044 [Coccomyxa subellipsoidea C-169]|uniref:Fatty acid desaturase domain-containing protein n=1 Tax=Coccomyxa subellipsoidea (strain C-169) TaxID=574566 RepID=I0YZQ9_COCSC|nr:hypothetical protein COCSUDRAFT_47044 [Coccomyxa subellipsoidea C-169]EIE23878.1 hypothetical protein COCSUDRAFT_47044 [Coccomyxa subellipsoidea C-169]|eukprot:XP_005648422.1 hypothetical protein COCSUDRAFT_47044 [Coccomyxa subellipsoidea C-169]